MTPSEIRAILGARYGRRNFKVTKSGHIHVKQDNRWVLYGWVGNAESDARLRSLAGVLDFGSDWITLAYSSAQQTGDDHA